MPADIVVESVPKFVRRYGDYVTEGSNNTILILGTDRAKSGPASIDDGEGHVNSSGGGKGTGTIHLIAGRKDKNPDLSKDESYLYVTRKTKADTNMGLEKVEQSSDGKPSIIVKSDVVRIVARHDVKVCTEEGKEFLFMKDGKIKIKVGENFVHVTNDEVLVDVGGTTKIRATSSSVETTIGKSKMKMTDGKIVVDSGLIELGEGATERLVLGDTFMGIFNNHFHVSPVGPTGPASATSPMTPAALSQRKVVVK